MAQPDPACLRATFLSRRACVRFLASSFGELKMRGKTKQKTGPPLTKKRKKKKPKEKLKFHFRLTPCASSVLLLLGRIISGSSSSPPRFLLLCRPPCALFLALVFVWLSVCLLGFIVVCLLVCLLNNPLALPLHTLAHPSRPALPSEPRPRSQ